MIIRQTFPLFILFLLSLVSCDHKEAVPAEKFDFVLGKWKAKHSTGNWDVKMDCIRSNGDDIHCDVFCQNKDQEEDNYHIYFRLIQQKKDWIFESEHRAKFFQGVLFKQDPPLIYKYLVQDVDSLVFHGKEITDENSVGQIQVSYYQDQLIINNPKFTMPMNFVEREEVPPSIYE